MRRLAPRPLSVAVDRYALALAPATTLARVQQLWEQAVGSAVCDAAEPVSEREGVLVVRCESAVWAQELGLMAAPLIERLNGELGEPLLRELRCRVG